MKKYTKIFTEINKSFTEEAKRKILLSSYMGEVLWIIQETEFLLVSLCYIQYKYILSDDDKSKLPLFLEKKFKNLTFEQIISDTETSKIVLSQTENFLTKTNSFFNENKMIQFRKKRNIFVHEYFLTFKDDKSNKKHDEERKKLSKLLNEIVDLKNIFQGYLDLIETVVAIKQGNEVNIDRFSKNTKRFIEHLVTGT